MFRIAAAFVLAPLLAAQTPPPPPQPPAPAPAPQQWTVTLLAFTGYALPDPAAIERNPDGTVTSCGGSLVFFVRCEATGELQLALTRDSGAPATKLVTTVAPHPAETNPPAGTKTNTVDAPAIEGTETIELGTFPIDAPGYRRIAIATGDGSPLRHLRTLSLSGTAAQRAHAVTRERRNAASVHLGYTVAPELEQDVEWFYCEVTPRTDPTCTFYMATGWSRGYFGMQVNSPTERRLIFSVWDAGGEPVDRAKVAAEDRVQLIAKGDGVVTSDFGNEGTGGHSHLVHDWKLGNTFRFLVRAVADGTNTTYTGWHWFAAKQEWGLIASFRAPKDGQGLRGLHSFVENFDGGNGQLARDCEFGNVWARTRGGEWLPLREARFTHDPQGQRQRHDRYAGLRGDRFFLRTGGFELPPAQAAIAQGNTLGVPDSARTHPADAELPAAPAPATAK